MRSSLDTGINDFWEGCVRWNAWTALALDDLRQRYQRTVLGPLWVTIAHMFFVGGFAIWASVVMKQSLADAFLYVAAGMTVWALIANSLSEAPTVFIRASSFIMSYDLPISIQVFRAVSGQMLTFGHNMIVYAIAVVAVGHQQSLIILMAIPGIIMLFLIFVAWTPFLAIAGARYRDLGPLISSIIGMLIILTPIFWRKADIPQAEWLANLNPIYHLIEIVRAPLLGYSASAMNWYVSLGVFAVCAIASTVAYSTNRKNVSYWL